MKVLIDISEELHSSLISAKPYDDVTGAIVKGKVIPEGSSNGDVLEIMFPEISIEPAQQINGEVTLYDIYVTNVWYNKLYPQ